ncbi:MAG: galactose-1-phosphate uridylyltransferase [Deltaproteobacteria bacterium]|nr:galactose-1-phosphate uridylyltransferase [Deltaproteobacteria bacterium]
MSGVGQIRLDVTTGEWVIYSGARAKRPSDLQGECGWPRQLPPHDEGCPFCPGHEEELGEVLLELPGKNPAGWLTRVVANKFPALSPQGSTQRRREGLHLAMDGYGRHEVIIESPRHDLDLADMDPAGVEAVVQTYQERYLAHGKAGQPMMTIIFRNHGARAGTSLIHPHSQLVTTPVVPTMIRLREAEAQRYWDRLGACMYCHILEEELAGRRRLLHESSSLAAFVPYAARVPLEMWVMPKRHTADFGEATAEELRELAAMLRDLLRRLSTTMDDPDYNLVINTAARHRAGEPHLHWYVEVRPRLTTAAGFEIGSGVNINPSLPEDDADFLNQSRA